MNKIKVANTKEIPDNYTGVVEYIENDTLLERSFLNGKLHSFNDQPAQRFCKGSYYWYKNGLIHRVCAPAAIYVGSIGDKKEVFYLESKSYAELDYWKNCWWYYRTPENEKLIAAKLLSRNSNVG